MRNMGSNIRSSGRLSTEEINEEEEIPRLDISKFQAGEEETDFLMHDQELEVLADPFGDRCCDVRKKNIDMANRELKRPLGQSCQKV